MLMLSAPQKLDATASKKSRPKDASLVRMFFGNDAPPLPDPRFRHRPPGEPRNTLSSIREKIGDRFVEQGSKELHERLIQNAEEKHHRKTLRNETLAASVGGILDPSLAGRGWSNVGSEEYSEESVRSTE